MPLAHKERRMLWFRNEDDLRKCVDAFNMETLDPCDRIVIKYGSNLFKYSRRKIGGEWVSACVGIFDSSIKKNEAFKSFMNRPENEAYLDIHTTHPAENITC